MTDDPVFWKSGEIDKIFLGKADEKTHICLGKMAKCAFDILIAGSK